MRILLAMACSLSFAAVAQTAPTGASAAPATNLASPTGTKMGTINIEQAIFTTNEGKRDLEALGKKLEPKQLELKGSSDEIESLKKQLNTQGEKLNDDARAALVKQLETRQKSFDRSVQDAREDAQNQQNEIIQRILQKMAPMIVKYAGESGYGAIIDTSQPWPQGPVVWYGPGVDITQPVVEAYNAQSGVAAPAGGGAAKPVPNSGAAKPATKPAKPPTTPPTTPPKK